MRRYLISLRILSCFLFLFFSLVVYRLIVLQIYSPSLSLKRNTIVEPKRGRILDRNLKELAISLDAYSLYAEKGMPDAWGNAKRLSKILNISFKRTYKKLRSKYKYTLLARNIPYQKVKECEKLDNSFLQFEKEGKGIRAYPKGELAGHLLGFTGTENNGLEGLEFAFDTLMMGMPGKIVTEKDAWGRTIVAKNRRLVPRKNGAEIVLTIDEVIQHIVEQELKKAYKDCNAVGGAAVVMDPKTGEILALANLPSFNPNNFKKYNKSRWRNRAITDAYEPGSTMKVFTAIGALEEKKVTCNEIINCEKDSLVVSGHTVHDSKVHEKISFKEVMEVSSNIGIVRVAMRLGEKRLYNYFDKFGFGQKTGIDLLGEASGMLFETRNWTNTSITAVPIGQEVAVTTIQLARGIAMVANGGYEIKPYCIKEIRSAAGYVIRSNKPEIGEKIISDITLEKINSILNGVVENGTGREARMKDYTAGAKTGTAQKFNKEKGGYASGEIMLTFIGYAPLDSPRLAIALMLDNPEKKDWAGNVLGPVFRNIAQRSLHYLNVIPDKKEKNSKIKNNNINVKRKKIDEQILFAKSGNSARIMPSVLGMSIRKTVELLSNFYLDVKVIGSGVAVRQVPSPGRKIEKGGTCIIYFAQK